MEFKREIEILRISSPVEDLEVSRYDFTLQTSRVLKQYIVVKTSHFGE